MVTVQTRWLNLEFLEGIVVGIYSNLLVFLIGKIDFESIQLFMYMLLFVSFGAFATLFLYQISQERPVPPFLRNMLLLGHFLLWFVVYAQYGKGTLYEKGLFVFVVFLFVWILQVAENKRALGWYRERASRKRGF